MNKVDKDEKNVLKCKYCDRVLGVNYKSRKHKCTCQGAEAIADAADIINAVRPPDIA